MAGVSINVFSNVREAVRGVVSFADTVDEASDRLRDLTKEGDTATDRMEADFRSVAKAADRASDELKSKFRDAYQSVRRNSDDTTDDVVRNQNRIKERSAEVGQEVRQNLGEGIANAARGDFASLADTIGDTLGGAVSGIGGIATAGAAAAGAAGLGLVVAAFQASEEAAKKAQEEASRWAEKFIESGQRIATAGQIAAEVISIQTDPERYADAKRAAEEWGVSTQTAVSALAGSESALAIVRDGMERMAEAAREEAQAAQEAAEAHGGQLLNLTPLEQALQRGEERYRALTAAQRQGRTQADEASASLQQLIADYSNVGVEIDEIGNKLVTLPDGEKIFIDVETGQASQNVDQFKGDYDGKVDQMSGHEVVMKVRVDSTAVDQHFNALQRRAAQGITVNVKPGQGRFWE